MAGQAYVTRFESKDQQWRDIHRHIKLINGAVDLDKARAEKIFEMDFANNIRMCFMNQTGTGNLLSEAFMQDLEVLLKVV